MAVKECIPGKVLGRTTFKFQKELRVERETRAQGKAGAGAEAR